MIVWYTHLFSPHFASTAYGPRIFKNIGRMLALELNSAQFHLAARRCEATSLRCQLGIYLDQLLRISPPIYVAQRRIGSVNANLNQQFSICHESIQPLC
jgi:hypothetical protein